MRRYHLNREAIYPYDEWKIVEDGYHPEYNHRNETIFALGNGYLGLRGTFEEGFNGDESTTTPGTYINGVYDSEEIHYGEYVYGMPQFSQSMLNLADWKIIRLQIEDEWFQMDQGQMEEYQRVLDLRQGTLVRSLIWTSPKGRQVKLCIERCISLAYQHRAAIRYTVTPVNFTGQVRFVSELNGDVQNYHFLPQRVLRTLQAEVEGNRGLLVQETTRSAITVAFGMDHRLENATGQEAEMDAYCHNQDLISIAYRCHAEEGQPICLEKYISVYTSRDLAKEELLATVANELAATKVQGFGELLVSQEKFLNHYWAESDVKIEGDSALQQGIRFNAFQLLQSCGRDGQTSIGAKGITGEWYEGHYFWDTEIYVNPFFLYSQPDLVKQLLLYRYSILDQARERAKVMRYKGALYAWRTINGHEASALFEGSTAQYHINAAISYAVYKYVEATEDLDFLIKYGAEILFETARLWEDRGGFIPLKGNKFCLNEVCGPDEYKAGVNNNCYTNYMARLNLQYAADVARLMKKEFSAAYQALQEKIQLKDQEVKDWQHCADEMYLPFNEELGIHPQDDTFLYKEDLDIDSLPVDEIPLVRNWHPLNIWRYQVCKQADVILLMLLQGNLFDVEVKKANYEYYEPRTTHDSSLSSCIFSIIASEIGKRQPAYDYFMQTARLDLDDYNNNVHEGVHVACLAGSWMAMTYGFAGMRVYDGQLSFKPYLPEEWEGYQFFIRFRGQKLQIQIDPSGVTYTLLEGRKLSFLHGTNEITLLVDETVQQNLIG